MSERYNFPRLTENFSRIVEILPPGSISLSPVSGNSIVISWDAVSNADSYELQRDTASDFSGSVTLYVGGNNSFTDTGLALNTTYYYRVKATRTTYIDSGWASANATTETPQSNETDFLTFSFPSQTGAATIDTGAHTIAIEVTSGTSPLALVASFSLSLGATVTVSAVDQVSGATPNDFSSPVTYVVKAEDGSTTQNWTITVTVASSAITSNVSVQGYGDRCRVSWAVTGDIPSTFLVEVSVNDGGYSTVDASYEMPDPFTGYKMAGLNRNFYYVHTGLTTGSTYKYRIDGNESNTITMAGTVYYVKTGGNDGLDGQSDGNAWATIAQAISTATTAGDLVLFNKGDSWSEGSGTFHDLSGNGTSDNPIVWAAYGTGNDPHLISGATYGICTRNLSYRNFEFLKISGSKVKGHTAIMLFAVYTGNVTGCKVLNCEVDETNMAASHPGGGVFFWSSLNSAYDRDGNAAKSYHITYTEIAYCYIHDCTSRSGIRSHDVKEGAHYHNNFLDNCSAAITTSGGANHVVEYNECKGGTYASPEHAGCKANSQTYWLNGMTYRRNLIYYMGVDGYGISLQNSNNGLVEYNTVYDPGDTYGSFYAFAEYDNLNWGPNEVKYNVFVGSNSNNGAARIDIGDIGDPWTEKFDWDYNLLYETSGHIVKYNNPTGTISDHATWLSQWQPAHQNDEHADPLFNDEQNGDFTLQSGSPALGMGVFGIGFTAPPTNVLLGADVIKNGGFTSWNSDDPWWWSLYNESGSDPMVTEASGAARMYSTGTYIDMYKSGILTVGVQYRISIDINSITGTLRFKDEGTVETTWTTVGTKTFDFTATATYVSICTDGGSNTVDATFTNIRVQPIRSTAVYNDNTGFEDGTYTSEWTDSSNNEPAAVIDIVTTPTLSGTYALHFQNPGLRAEVWPKFSNGIFHWGRDYKIGFGVYLKNWNTNTPAWSTFVQAHSAGQYEDGGAGRNGFTLYSNNNYLHFHAEDIPDPYIANPYTGAIGPSAWSIVLPENEYLRFVVEFRLSLSSDGYIKVTYNDSVVVDKTGPNVHYYDNDGDAREQHCSLQCGIYKDGVDTLEAYIDEFKIGGHQATFEDVEPPTGGRGILYGPDELSDGDFAQVGAWVEDSGWIVDLGVATATATTGRVYQTFGNKNKNMRASIEVTHTSGEYRIRDSAGHVSAWQTTSQTFIFDSWWGSNFIIESNGSNPFTGVVDNASLKEIL
jgi:hypothetical protein